MRTLRRNKQMMKYSLQTTTKVPIYAKDSAGNTKYYTDSEGNKIPLETGEYEYAYSAPVSFYANISMGGGEAVAQEYGLSVSDFDATMVTELNAYPIEETSVLWYDSEVVYKDAEKTIPNAKKADFRIVAKKPSLNYMKYVLKRITK